MDQKRPLEDSYSEEDKRQRVEINRYEKNGQYQIFPGVYVNLPDNHQLQQQQSYQQPSFQQPNYQQQVYTTAGYPPVLNQPSYMNYQQPLFPYNIGYQQFQHEIPPMTPQQQIHSQWQPQSYSSYMNLQPQSQNPADTASDDDNDAPEISSSKLPPPPLHLKHKFTSLPSAQNSGTFKKKQLNDSKTLNNKKNFNAAGKGRKSAKPSVNGDVKQGSKDVELVYSDDSENEDSGPEDDKLSKTVIQGTNIVLESEEDVQKWIEERRKNWPTNKRVNDKKELLEKAQKNISQIASQAKPSSSRPICRFFQKTGRCKHGANCKFSHQSQQQQLKALPNHKVKVIHGIPVQIPQRFTPLQHKGKSLDSLLFEEEHFKSENLVLLSVFTKLSEGGHLAPWDDVLHKLNLN